MKRQRENGSTANWAGPNKTDSAYACRRGRVNVDVILLTELSKMLSQNGSPEVDSIPAATRALLISYAIFAILAAILSAAMLASRPIAELLLPHFGWPVVGFAYLGSLVFIAAALTYPRQLPLKGFWKYLRGNFLIMIAYGVLTTLVGWVGGDFGNPYLTASIWQPIWTILVPLGWLLLFYQQTHIETDR